MTEQPEISPSDALAGLPLLYVHLCLELAVRPQGLNNELANVNQHGPGYNGGSMPIREDVWHLIERLNATLRALGSTDINEATVTVQRAVVRLYLDAREVLGLGNYVRVMVLPCPNCDHRALTRALDAPTVRCEYCTEELTMTAYLTFAELRRSGEKAV